MRRLLCGAQAPLCIGLASLSFASSHSSHFSVLLGLGQPTARPEGAAGVAGASGEPFHCHLMRVRSTRQKENVRVSAHPPCPSLPCNPRNSFCCPRRPLNHSDVSAASQEAFREPTCSCGEASGGACGHGRRWGCRRPSGATALPICYSPSTSWLRFWR